MEHEGSILYGPVNALAHQLGLPHIPDHVIMAFLVLVISSTVFPILARGYSKDDPGPLQQFFEMVLEGLKNLMEEIVGHGQADRFLDVVGGFTVFIFIANIFGLFFFLQPPTSNPNTTFALSVSAFIYYNFVGIREQGIVHYLKHFGGPIWWLAPLMFPIELIGHFARILSLGMRLFGNIFGEHTATGIFMSLLPLALPWPMMGLGIFGAVLQTFIFVILTIVYIGGAVMVEEH